MPRSSRGMADKEITKPKNAIVRFNRTIHAAFTTVTIKRQEELSLASTIPDHLIRTATVDDADLVRDISAAAYVPVYERKFDWVPKPATEDYLPRIKAGQVLVLETDRHGPCGVLVVEILADALMIYSVAVRPEAQGDGLAGLLLARADSIALASGHKTVRLYTNTQMTDNIRLYESCGFKKTARRPHPSRKGLELQDMEKRL